MWYYHNWGQKPEFVSQINNIESGDAGVLELSPGPEVNKQRLADASVKVGFHQHFDPIKPGWKAFYDSNYAGLNNLQNSDSLKTGPISNYLSCLTNLDNVYKHVSY